jgi:hypothetical protein
MLAVQTPVISAASLIEASISDRKAAGKRGDKGTGDCLRHRAGG